MSATFKVSILRNAGLNGLARPVGTSRSRHSAQAALAEIASARPKVAEQPTGPLLESPSTVLPPASAATEGRSTASAASDAFVEGREAGLREGLNEAKQRLDEAIRAAEQQMETQTRAAAEKQKLEHAALMKRLDAVLLQFSAAAAKRLDALEPAAIELAFEALCRIVGESLADRGLVAGVVQQAMAQLRSGVLQRVRLHPDDLAALSGSEVLSQHAAVAWVPDPSIARGGCVLEADNGTLDARLDRQLARLRDVWASTYASAPRIGAKGG